MPRQTATNTEQQAGTAEMTELASNIGNVGFSARGRPVGNATRIPSHGQGRLVPYQPGQSGNPSGRPKTMKEVRVLARKQSMDALIALIGCYKRPDGRIDRAVDGRVVVAAASTVLKWAYGEPPPYDPNAEKSDVRINLEGMSLAERRRILEIMDRVETVAADSDSGDDDGPSFDASRFAPEPVTIEADVVVPPAPAQRSPKAIAPKAAKQPQQPQRLKLPSDSIP